MSALAGDHWLANEAATLTLGAQLATLPCPQVVYLYGDLGAGKTTLVRGTLRALGYEGAVRSPTYTLLERYELGGKVIVHFDLYRLADPEELHALGLRELLEEAAMLFFEWPERGEGLLPPATLTLRFDLEGDGRRVHGIVP
ncbi:MAG: tRNA (adenosine(37)-N6)-threonylcarbamoyltransferase complex ATPase subunit type 1 TsaE [Pseudomonadales bacterium]|jgi:tRNA threonylcarbamoyladenosine biosynthesis protein TsaE|nr:tRNA (adenosine(37)-N6)-threonylcarbamoyltransferase complex ATPase subunit type 1 TsaE [Gammaproteobacteria bacterium]